MLYFIQSNEWFKVGYASSIKRRMQAYATHNPSTILLGVREGTLEDESDYHKMFDGFEKSLEWYKLSDEMVKQVLEDFHPFEPAPKKEEWTFNGKKYKLWCRKSKMRKNGTAPVELAYYEDGKRTVKTLELFWNPLTFIEDVKTEPLKSKLEQEIQKHIN